MSLRTGAPRKLSRASSAYWLAECRRRAADYQAKLVAMKVEENLRAGAFSNPVPVDVAQGP